MHGLCFFLSINPVLVVAESWKLPGVHELLDHIINRASEKLPEEHEILKHIVSDAAPPNTRAIAHRVVSAFLERFPQEIHEQHAKDFSGAVSRYKKSNAYTAYHLDPDQPRCDKSMSATQVTRVARRQGPKASFPGGIVMRPFGFDFGKMAYELLSNASGPADASSMPVQVLTSTAIGSAVGLVQAIVSVVLHVVPPLIPPPIWINMPLPCLPMLTGHNCFGAILHLITAADFASADVTDKAVEGYISGFPKLFYSKVGTDSSLYVPCFSAYMSMHCASIFPMCTIPLSRDEPIPVGGRVPMCVYHCIMTLIACPGFWLEDIDAACTNVMLGVPPMCTTAAFWNINLLPPQYTREQDMKPPPTKCPKQDLSFAGLDVGFDVDDPIAEPESPILEHGNTSLPPSATKFLQVEKDEIPS